MLLSARRVTSASPGLSPAASIAALTATNASGAVSTSIEPSSGYTTTSSAPASIATSVIFSSSEPAWNHSTPRLANMKDTEPSVPRLPPNLPNAWRTSATVRTLLSVRQSTITATPPGA